VQIETRNPHFHDNKGEEHVQGMRMQALNVVYHSPVTLPAVRQAIIDLDLLYDGAGRRGTQLPAVRRPGGGRAVAGAAHRPRRDPAPGALTGASPCPAR
jgi:Mannosyl-3-phosphoglycerate synthase (osmo_MPGsynth)